MRRKLKQRINLTAWPSSVSAPSIVSRFTCYCSYWRPWVKVPITSKTLSYGSYQDCFKQLQMTRNNLTCQDLNQYHCTLCTLYPNYSICFRLSRQVQNSENSLISFRSVNIDKPAVEIFIKSLLVTRKNLKCHFVHQYRGALTTTCLKAYDRSKVQISIFRQ